VAKREEVKESSTQEQNEKLLQAVTATYKREELIAHSASALGVPSYIAAGALTESEYTIAAAKKAIEAFKRKEVK
jgi:hypothetical protein